MEQTSKRHKNLIGPQIRKIRDALGWPQSKLAAKLQRAGWDLSRGELAKIEAQIAYVREYRLCYLIRVLGVRHEELFPPIDSREAIDLAMDRLLEKKKRLLSKKPTSK